MLTYFFHSFLDLLPTSSIYLATCRYDDDPDFEDLQISHNVEDAAALAALFPTEEASSGWHGYVEW
jgi:hypothetical protein